MCRVVSNKRLLLTRVTKQAAGHSAIASRPLRQAGWTDAAVCEITALASFFNFSGRLEAASGLPPDRVPENAKFAEAGTN